VLDFVKGQKSNFNYDALKQFYQQQGFDAEQTTRALYHDLEHFKEFSFEPSAPQAENSSQSAENPLGAQSATQTDPTEQSPTELPQSTQTQSSTTPPSTPTQSTQQVTPSKKDPQAILKALEDRAHKLEQQAGIKEDVMQALSLGMSEPEALKLQKLGYHQLIQDALKDNVPYEKLPKSARQYLSRVAFEKSSITDALFHPLEYFGGDRGKGEYQQERMRASILKLKDAAQLSAEQKRQIYRDRNFGTSLFNSLTMDAKQDLQEYQEQLKARHLVADVSKAMALYDNIAQEKNIFNMLFNDDPKLKEQYRAGAQAIAKAAGFEGVHFDEKGL
ncbi:hypothetical protein, partial [Helicobacter salomonis]|uniref:hypothetical protein n=1 Tax=Helicobacter salomonis TaxID=56878 RepID=UPI0013152DA3